MKRKYAIVTAALVALMGAGFSTDASALTWVVSPTSPAGGTMVFSSTDVVAVSDIGDPEGENTQTEAIYGAGFELPAASGYEISFDVDLLTWDSYNVDTGYGTGYWDVFVVNINQEGYYWELVNGGTGSVGDPVVGTDPNGTPVEETNGNLPGATWAWGGSEYDDGVLESIDPLTDYTVTFGWDSTQPYYVSLVLDTATSPHDDTNYSSYGSFHVGSVTEVVPEPSTLLMLGSGLVGFGFWMKRRKA